MTERLGLAAALERGRSPSGRAAASASLGGSIALNNPQLILDPIREDIHKYIINRMPEIMITPLGEDVVLYGALAHALKLSGE